MTDQPSERTFTAEERSRAACQTLIEAIGSIGPENVEDAAKRAVTALAAAHERETALREEVEHQKDCALAAVQNRQAAEAALAEVQRERDEALRRSLQCCCVALAAERQKVQELREWHEGWIAMLSRPEARSADNVVQKQAHLTALEKLDALGLTDADRALGERG